eukprot:jgi/Botrbrau1/22217/Bobra.168_1s0048.1
MVELQAASVASDPFVGLDAWKLVAQGAEARVFEGTFLGRPTILKQRFNKKYRHPYLDAKLTTSRLKGEVRSIVKARKVGVRTPVVYYVEFEANAIYMEKVPGRSLKELMLSAKLSEQERHDLLTEVGRVVAAIHDGGLVHGDLTTSNILVRDSDRALVMIDFGLAYNSTIPEDKAVDLYVLERAFTSAHAAEDTAFNTVLASYRQHSRNWSSVLNKFAEVRMRGRKRAMVG